MVAAAIKFHILVSTWNRQENGEVAMISSELPWRLVNDSCLRVFCPLLPVSLWLAVYLVSCLPKLLVFGLQARRSFVLWKYTDNNHGNCMLFWYLPTFLSAGSFLHGNIQVDLQVSPWLVVLFSYLLWLLSYLEESLCLHETFSNTVVMCPLEMNILSSCAKQGLQS